MDKIELPVEYRDVPGHPGYRAGSDGTIWSAWVRGARPLRVGCIWVQMGGTPHRDGHIVVQLSNPRRGPVGAHVLVLEAFVGPCPEGMEARHFPDRDPANNRLSNLSWATHLTNQRDRIVHGTACRGADCYAAKLTEEQVRAARAEWVAGGIKQRDLAKKYGIRQGPMSDLLLRKSWKNVA